MSENYLTMLSKVLGLSLKEKITFLTDLFQGIPQEARYLLLIDIFTRFDKRTLNNALQVVKTKNMIDKTVSRLDNDYLPSTLLETLSENLEIASTSNNNHA